MSVSSTKIDPSRSLVSNKPAPAANSAPAASSAPALAKDSGGPQGESRLQQQQRYMSNMWSQLGQDAHLAAIMFNPLFMVQSQAIADAAVAEAVRRYETEVPQQDFNVLYNQEMAKARTAILGLPDLYAKYGQQALNATGAALLDAYDTTSQAVATAAEYTGKAAKTGFMAVVGFFAMAGEGILHGIGHVLHGIGSLFTGAGGALEKVGN